MKNVLRDAFEAYRWKITLGELPFDQYECDAIDKCVEYLNGDGNVDDKWLDSKMVIWKAVAIYHSIIDADLKSAKKKMIMRQ